MASDAVLYGSQIIIKIYQLVGYKEQSQVPSVSAEFISTRHLLIKQPSTCWHSFFLNK